MLPSPESWLFLLGCQRSGTTLLRLILESHRDISCFDEIDVYRLLASGDRNAPASSRYTLLKVPRYTEQIDAAVWRDWGESDVAGTLYEGQRILFLVRDWRDVVVSMHNLPGWLETWGIPIIEAKIQNEPRFAAEFAREIAIARASSRTVAMAAFYWTYKTRALLRYRAAGYPVLAISYEKLVLHPEAELRRVCGFLELPFETALLHHTTFPHREVLPSGVTVGNTDPAKPINSDSVSRWKSFASEEIWSETARIVGDLPESCERLWAGEATG